MVMRRFCSTMASVANKAKSSATSISRTIPIKDKLRIVDLKTGQLTSFPLSQDDGPELKVVDIVSGKTLKELREEENTQFGVNLGTTCTPISVLTSAYSGKKWGKKVYFSQYVIDAMAHAQDQGDYTMKAPDVYVTITNPFNGLSLSHIGRLNNTAETTDCPMFMHDSLQPIYGGSGTKTGLGGSKQMAYATLFQFHITGIKSDGGWTISDQALERLDTNKTAFIPATVVPVTTPGNEISLGLPFLRKFGLVLDCHTKTVNVSNDEWKLNVHYGQFPQDMKSSLVDA